MKSLKSVVSIALAFVMLLGAIPVSVFAEGAVTVESAEVIGEGVTVYHNSDGSETLVVKGAVEAGTEEKGSDRLTDQGEYLVGTGDEVSLIIEKEFREGQPLVSLSGNGTAVSFYPVVPEQAAEQEEPSEEATVQPAVEETEQAAEQEEPPEEEATVQPAAEETEQTPVTGGEITGFHGYSVKKPHVPLTVIEAVPEQQRPELNFPGTLRVSLNGEEELYSLRITTWKETEGTYGDDRGEWRFQPVWDRSAFPLSEELQEMITGDPEVPDDDDPFVVPYILVRWTIEETTPAEEEDPETEEAGGITAPAEESGPEPGPVSGEGDPSPAPEETTEPPAEEEPITNTEEPQASEETTTEDTAAPSVTEECPEPAEARDEDRQDIAGQMSAVRTGGVFVRTMNVRWDDTETAEPAVTEDTKSDGTDETAESPEPLQPSEAEEPEEDIETTEGISSPAGPASNDGPANPAAKEGPLSVKGKRSGQSAVVYEGVFGENTDIRLSALKAGVKEDVIIGEYTGDHVFRYRIQIEDLTLRKNSGEILLCKGDQLIAKIEAPYMQDAAGGYSRSVTVSVSSVGNGEYELTYTPNDAWLRSDARVYPVKMDPTLVFTGSTSLHMEDNYVSSEEPDTTFTYNATEIKTGSKLTAYIRPVFVDDLYDNAERILIKEASLHMYCKSGSGQLSMHQVKGPWNSRTITYNTAPAYGSALSTQRVSRGWNEWDITELFSKWFHTLDQAGGFGLALTGSGNAVFASADTPTNRMYYSVTYYRIDEKNSVTANPVKNADETGYIDLSWDGIPAASGYYVGVYNGKEYEYVYVGNTTNWTTKGKGIWPTAEEIARERYRLHWDGSGSELPVSPLPVYRNANYTAASIAYAFDVRPANEQKQAADPGYTVTAVMPHALVPSQPVSVQVSPSVWTNGHTVSVSWSGITDHLADGTELTVLEDGSIQYSIDGVSSWTNTGKNTASGTYTADISALADGTHAVYIRGKDKDGNEGAPLGAAFYIDRTAPTAPDVAVIPDSWTNESSVILDWSGIEDTLSGIARVEYRVDAGSWTDTGSVSGSDNIALSTDTYTDGVHTVQVRAADAAGNTGEAGEARFQKDTKVPTAEISVSPAGWTEEDTVTLIWSDLSDSSSGTGSLAYSVDGSPYITLDHTQSAGSAEIDCSGMTDGVHTVDIRFGDNAGNIGTETVYIYRDTAVPEVALLHPQTGDPVNGAVNITGTVNDLSIDKWTVTASGSVSGEKTVVSGTGNLSAALLGVLDVGPFADGEEITLTLTATDKAGHSTSTSGVVVKVDKSMTAIAGTVRITSPANGQTVSEATVAGSYTGGSAGGHMYIDGVETQTTDGYGFAFNAIRYPDGSSHTLTVITGTDGALEYSEGLGALVIGSGAPEMYTGTMESGTLTAPKNILALQLETTQSGTDISYLYSADNGKTWETITPGADVRMKTATKTVLLKAEADGSSALHGWELRAVIEKDPVTVSVDLKKPVRTFDITETGPLTEAPEQTIAVALNEDSETYRLYADGMLVNETGFAYETLLTPENGSVTLAGLALDKEGTLCGSGTTAVLSLKRETVTSEEQTVATGKITAQQPVYAVRLLAETAGTGCDFYVSADNENWEQIEPDTYLYLSKVSAELYFKAEQTEVGQLKAWHIEGVTVTGKNLTVTLAEPPKNVAARDYGKYSDKRYELSWTPSEGADMYVITRNGSVLGSTTAAVYTDNDYTAGAVYTVRTVRTFPAPDTDPAHIHYLTRESEAVTARNVTVAKKTDSSSGTASHELIDFTETDTLRELYGDTYLFTRDMLTPPQTQKLNQKLLGSNKYCSLGFEPVNFNTGNFFLETADYSKSDIGLGLEILRTYNAQSTVADGPFGAKWETPFTQRLELYADGNIGYRAANGALTVFTAGTNGYEGNDDEHYTFTVDRENDEYRVTEKDGTAYVFSRDLGWLMRIEDRNGNALRMERGANGYLTGIVAQSGAGLRFRMDKKGHITRITLPDGKILKYTYQGNDLVAFTDQLNHTTRYIYDSSGRMTGWVDAAGHSQVRNTYDSESRVIFQTDVQGGEYTLRYEDDRTVVTDAMGNTSEIRFDSAHRTIKEVNALGASYGYLYDGDGNLSGTTDAYGKLTSSEYDNRGNQVKNILPDGTTGTKTYNEQNDILTYTDGNGHTTSYTYDARGNLLTETDPTGSVTTYGYNEYGQVISVTDPTGVTVTCSYAGADPESITDGRGNTTRYEYDRSGRPLLSADALGNITRYSYDAAGNLKKLTFADRTSMTYTYDALGNCTSMTDPLGNKTVYTYDAMSRQTAITYADGTTESVEYDLNSNPVKTVDTLGNVMTAEYDRAGNRVSVTDALGNTTKYEYDRLDRLVKETLPTGAAVTYVYDADTGLVTGSTNEAGISAAYTYDKSGNLLTTTLPNGAVSRVEYDAADRVIRQTDPLGNSISYTYDPNGRLSSFTNALGGVTQYTYDGNGNQLTETDALGNVTRKEYDPLNRISAIVDPLGARTVYTYDGVGNLISVTDANGSAETYGYDANGNMIKLTDALGNRMSFDYDALGSVTRSVQKNRATVATEYDAAGRAVKETDALGHTTEYVYNALGQVTEISDALGQKAKIAYDPLGNVTALTGPDGAVTKYTYAASGRVVSETGPTGAKTEYGYDSVSNITSVTTNGNTTTYEYDLAGNITAMTDAEGRRVTFRYDKAGNLIRTEYPDGTFDTMAYDLLGRLTRQKPRKGVTVSYAYDAAGNLISVTEGSRTTRYEYDLLGNCVKTVYPDGTGETASYDVLGNLTAAADALGNTVHYSYNESSLLKAVTYANGTKISLDYDKAGNITGETDAKGNRKFYTYDAVGRMTAVTDALGNRTHYEYDAADNLVKVTDANGNVTGYTYDKNGSLLSETDALGNTRKYSYTPEGWLEKITKADGATVSYEYDRTGNITKEYTSDGQITTHTYNRIGELITTECGTDVTKYQYNSNGYLEYVVNPGGEAVNYDYDEYGRKIKLTYPDGRAVSYTYDEMDRMTGVTDTDGETTVYTYDAAGRRIKTSTPTLTTEYAYDAIGNLTKQQTTGKTELSVEYVYDLNNGITEETRTENGNSVKSKYTYDKLGQLTAWSNSAGYSETYSYDAVGNMTAKVTNGTKISMTYDAANELKTMESVNGRIDYSYDANGNLAKKALGEKTDTYSYDAYDRLVSYKGYDGYCQRYTYNAQGHTVKKETQGNGDRQTLEEIVRGDEEKAAASEGDDDDPDPYANSATSGTWQVTTYVYDITAPYYEVLTETTNGQTTAYTYGTERIAAHTTSAKTQYVYDGRGSVALEITGTASAGILSKSYTPFGEQLNTKTSGYGFNGEYYDSATGMVNLRARQYEPAMNRFSQKDILKGNKAIPLTQNLYTYCINDPVNFIDPSGNQMMHVDVINAGGGSEASQKAAETKEKTARLTGNVSTLIKSVANGTASLTNTITVATEKVKANAKSIAAVENALDVEIKSNISTNASSIGLSKEVQKIINERTSSVLAQNKTGSIAVTDLWKTVEPCTYGPVKSTKPVSRDINNQPYLSVGLDEDYISRTLLIEKLNNNGIDGTISPLYAQGSVSWGVLSISNSIQLIFDGHANVGILIGVSGSAGIVTSPSGASAYGGIAFSPNATSIFEQEQWSISRGFSVHTPYYNLGGMYEHEIGVEEIAGIPSETTYDEYKIAGGISTGPGGEIHGSIGYAWSFSKNVLELSIFDWLFEAIDDVFYS